MPAGTDFDRVEHDRERRRQRPLRAKWAAGPDRCIGALGAARTFGAGRVGVGRAVGTFRAVWPRWTFGSLGAVRAVGPLWTGWIGLPPKSWTAAVKTTWYVTLPSNGLDAM